MTDPIKKTLPTSVYERALACDRQNPHIDAFYAAIGQPRPAVLERGEHVHKWRKAQR